jgi:predicted porin
MQELRHLSYDYLNKNKDMDYKQQNYVAGIQYWFYPKCRLQAQYTYCDNKKGENYNRIQTQIQVRF